MSTVRTKIPARLDRLPWARWHWMIVVGLGSVWIVDGFEVTVVGSVAAKLSEPDSGLPISSAQVSGLAAAMYVAGACVGALLFGWLTDRYGRKKLFIVTLVVYLVATALTAFSFSLWWFVLFRFLTGLGIGGEYAAINSAIDELIPSKYRGRIDIIINGTYWLGASGGALLSVAALNPQLFAPNIGWRLMFGMGVIFGLLVLVVRRHVPESPRWMFIHGRDRQAEELVAGVEDRVRRETGARLPEVEETIEVRQRRSTGFGEIASVMLRRYPRRSTLGLALFVGQAFLYNAVTFNFAVILGTSFDVPSDRTGYFYAVMCLGSFFGPLVLGRFFDTVGRKPMIAGSYLGSGILLLGTAMLLVRGDLTAVTLTACWTVVLFVASCGASSAYLTVSEIFPMETRAMAIAFFYAVGTAAGGIAGPLVFAELTEDGDPSRTALAFTIGAVVMMVGGIAELILGVRAEGRSLESIAAPLSSQRTG
ncbi:MFS transporter [Nocardia sp. CDC159]|uniref:MFS transporter n=1 Tax=Nocardia pulmonis TaxID=2951408 RepID=A0A9X2EIQ8_9NOCA|nr:MULTISPECIES: MFS transporter [Nocardia]MCM6778861.1 MFS transporter [Nocardia pulmonis]MCM6791750.1 MFS transporter [Nocardia sp. CDC159]